MDPYNRMTNTDVEIKSAAKVLLAATEESTPRAVIDDAYDAAYDLHSMGDSRLERIFSLIQMGDFISYYLAVLNEVDPTPVEVIENLKARLIESQVN